MEVGIQSAASGASENFALLLHFGNENIEK